jgi:hypothetical protein
VTDRVAAFIVGEGNWLPLAMALALAAVTAQWMRHSRFAGRDRVMEAMNLFVGVTLLVMGIGHLLAVMTKVLQGTLNGSPVLLSAIGVAIVIPSALIALNANGAKAAACNGWMAATLVVLGLINIPLAIPALLNIAYRKHSRPGIGIAIVVTFVLVNLGLFTGGMLFMFSGARTFEEFSL